VPFQSPEIVETSSPCSPQKETNKRCTRARDRPASNGRSGQSNPTEQRKKARSPAGAAANEASFVGRAGFRAPGRKCICRPCRLSQASARRAAAQQTNNTTMHKREPKPIAGRRHQRGRQQQRRRDRPRLEHVENA
jgi:hypothetical protein